MRPHLQAGFALVRMRGKRNDEPGRSWEYSLKGNARASRAHVAAFAARIDGACLSDRCRRTIFFSHPRLMSTLDWSWSPTQTLITKSTRMRLKQFFFVAFRPHCRHILFEEHVRGMAFDLSAAKHEVNVDSAPLIAVCRRSQKASKVLHDWVLGAGRNCGPV
jgi:hypothetical protein